MERLKDQNLIIAEAVAIGDGSSSPVTKNLDSIRCGKAGGMIRFELRANTEIVIATDKTFIVEIKTGAKDSEASPVSGGHFYPYYKDTDDDAKTFAAGELICTYDLPAEQGPYIKPSIYSDSDHSAAKVDCYLYPEA